MCGGKPALILSTFHTAMPHHWGDARESLLATISSHLNIPGTMFPGLMVLDGDGGTGTGGGSVLLIR